MNWGISEPRRRHKEEARAPENTADNWDIKINIDSRTEENPRFSLDTSSTPLVHDVIPETELFMCTASSHTYRQPLREEEVEGPESRCRPLNGHINQSPD